MAACGPTPQSANVALLALRLTCCSSLSQAFCCSDDPYTPFEGSPDPASSDLVRPQPSAHTDLCAACSSPPSEAPQLDDPSAELQPPFAMPSNINECVAFLRPSLDALGMRVRLPDVGTAAADPGKALAAALNATYELMQLVQRSQQQRKQQEELVDKLRSEAKAAEKAAQALRGQSDQREQEVAGLKIKVCCACLAVSSVMQGWRRLRLLVCQRSDAEV